MSNQSQYSAAEIRKALAVIAKVITLYGDKYLPLFERLERELELAERREATLARVKALSENV